MTPKEIIVRVKNIRDAYENGEINSQELLDHIDDMIILKMMEIIINHLKKQILLN